MHWFYYFGRIIVRTLLKLLTRWQVTGKENVPNEGALLIVANHISLADPPVIGASLSRRVLFMAKEELFRAGFSRFIVGSLGAFPVHRGRIDKQALQNAKRVLAQGQALVMFPEGTRSKSLQLQAAFPGSALIALQSSVPILPIGIMGTEKIKGLSWMLHRPRITVNIGCPFHLPMADTKTARLELARFTDFIMEHIAELVPPEKQGRYARKDHQNVTED